MQLPDFSNLTALQFAVLLIAVGLSDMFTGVYGALRAGSFDVSKLLDVLDSHGLKRIIPLGLLFGIGEVSGVPGLCLLATGGLAAYVGETVISSVANITAAPAS